jgi:hypothetical protein
MKIDPYTSGGDLRPQLEALTREDLQALIYAAVAELTRRALRGEEEKERNKKSADTPRHLPDLDW